MSDSQPSGTDVFVLGAGFSAAISTAMPLTIDLFDACLEVMKELNLKTADDEAVLSAYARLGGDFETWMTWMSGDQPWLGAADNMRNRAAFDDLARSIATVILRRQNLAVSPEDFVPPPWLVSLIEAWGKVGATVITLNYDLLVEKTFEAVINARSLFLYSFPMANVGGEGILTAGVGRFRLLKLHGSISWYVFSGLNGPVSPVYDADFNRGWAMGPEKEADLLQRVGGRVPLIVPPVLGKDPYLSLPELRDQWLRAEMALRQAGRVFLLGYRLPHTDLPMRFLLDRTPEDCTIIPVNTDAEVASRIETHLQPRPVTHEYSGKAEPIAALASDYSSSGQQQARRN